MSYNLNQAANSADKNLSNVAIASVERTIDDGTAHAETLNIGGAENMNNVHITIADGVTAPTAPVINFTSADFTDGMQVNMVLEANADALSADIQWDHATGIIVADGSPSAPKTKMKTVGKWVSASRKGDNLYLVGALSAM